MTELFEDTIRFVNDDPLGLLLEVTARARQVAEAGGTIHSIDLTFEDAEGSASMILTLTYAQAQMLGYAGSELERLREQEIKSPMS